MRAPPSESKIRLALLRSVVWALIGLIYAPLFLGLLAVFRDLGLGHAAFVPASLLATTVGAIFYGARQVGLAGTAIGLMVASLLLLIQPGAVGLWGAVGLATLVGGVLGWWVEFPERCSLQVPAKAVAGLTSGALSGAVLALAEPLHPFDFRAASTLAFLVSVNGVLYVSTVSWWLRRAAAGDNRHCGAVEVGVVALLSGLAAGGLWLGASPLVGLSETGLSPVLASLEAELPLAMVGGVFGGALVGVLLQGFGFRWVHDA
jgi:hypothetical protein